MLATVREPLLDVYEVAALIGCSIWSVQRWARLGQLTALRLPGGGLRFRREDVQEMLQRKG